MLTPLDGSSISPRRSAFLVVAVASLAIGCSSEAGTTPTPDLAVGAEAFGPSAMGAPSGSPVASSDANAAGDGASAAPLPGEGEGPSEPRASGAAMDGNFTELTWEELYELDLETGKPSPLLEGLDGQPVKIPGFMVPLDDAATYVREFLLVPYAGACIHVPPPPPNQIVYVTMVDGFETELYWWDPIWIYGSLEIDPVDHAFGSASYRLDGLRTEIYQP